MKVLVHVRFDILFLNLLNFLQIDESCSKLPDCMHTSDGRRLIMVSLSSSSCFADNLFNQTIDIIC